MLDVPWEKCDVVWGNTAKNLPWTCVSGGSQTTHAMTRAAHAAATDAMKKLQEIAAKIARRRSRPATRWRTSACRAAARSMTFAQAAQKAIELGGKYDGHELPERHQRLHEDVGDGARRSGPDGRREGQLPARRTITILSSPASPKSKSTSRPAQSRCSTITAVADVGTVINPRSLKGQIFGGVDARHRPRASTQQWVYDQHYGVPLAKRFHHNKPPTILDIAGETSRGTPSTSRIRKRRSGARGVGEPPVGAGCGAVMNAIADAVGDDIFRRSPVTADMILTSLENGAMGARFDQAH